MAAASRTVLALWLLLATAFAAPSAPCAECPASAPAQTAENSSTPTAAQQTPAGQPGVAAAGAAHPMAAYLALRPALPTKPAFLPPFVDPNAFVDKKAALLSNLFGAAPPPGAYAPAASPYYIPAPGYAPGYGPGYGPAAFSPPSFFAAKKTSFLGSLFNTLQQPATATPPQSKRAAVPAAAPATAPAVGTGFVAAGAFAAKKAAFLKKLFDTLNSTAAPDDADEPESAPLPTVPLTGPSPVDPAVFTDKKTAFLSALFDSLSLPPPTPAAPAGVPPFWSTYYPAAAAPAPTLKPTIVPPGFWSPFAPAPAGAPAVFPPVKPTIVPPGFWVPPGKPAPPTSPYKAKVAVFLDKLFNSLNASTDDGTSSAARRNIEDSLVVENNEESSAEGNKGSRSRRFIGSPFAVPGDTAPAKPFAPFGPFGGLKPFGPGGPYGPGGPFGKPFMGGPFAGAKPFAPFAPAAPVVDPKVFLDKKTTFLGQLFASKAAASAAPPAATDDASAAADFWSTFGVPTPKPTIVPPGFWSPFGAASLPVAPTPKPTIVPPGFWSPFAAPAPAPGVPAPAAAMLDKKTAFLQKLYETLNTTPAPPTPEPETPDAAIDDDDFDAFLAALAEVVAVPGPAKRSVGAAPASPELARQQLLDSVVAQMATLKDDMVGTVDEILKTKASAAAAQPAFPFAKPFAAYGAGKMGPGAAAGKKGGPPPFVGKKAGPPPFVGAGGPPFWGAAAPTPDPTLPLQQRLKMLSQAFDSLAAIEKDASAAVQAAADSATPAPEPAPAPKPDTAALLEYLRSAAAAPPARKSKASKLGKERSVHFAVRQGQLSLPPGAEELLTAGGGANGGDEDAHEGGGLRLQIKVPA